LNEFDDKEANEFFNLVRKLRRGMEDVLGIKIVIALLINFFR